MTRSLKTLALTLCVAFTMGALSAPSASAVDVFTTANGGPVLVTAVTHDSVFKMTGTNVKVECTTARFAGRVEHGATEAEIDTEYLGKINETPHTSTACTSTIGSVTLDTNGCQTRTTGETTGEDEGQKDATVWMECSEGQTVKITSSLGPVLSFPAQTPTMGGATGVNLPSHEGGSAIKGTGTWTGVTFTCAPTFTCTLSGIPHHGDTVDINGTATFTGYELIEGLPTPVTEGARVGISIS